MKAYLLIVIGTVFFGLTFTIHGQDNSSVSEILRNKNLHDILGTVKNNPEETARKVQENPDDIVRNVTAIFADQQKKNSDEVPATRSSRSQTDQALENLRNKFASPPSSNGESRSLPGAESLNQMINSDKINDVKRAAREAIPDLNSMIPTEDAPKQATPRPPTPPSPSFERQTRPIQPSIARPTDEKLMGSPLSLSSNQAPSISRRDSGPIQSQIPNSSELFAEAPPAPQTLQPRYPEPEKFNLGPSLKTNDSSGPKPKDDTMVITSSQSEMDRNSNTLTFSGDVKIAMKDMTMTCDNLLVKLDSDQKMKEIIATGGTVEIKRYGEDGKLQVAKCRKANHVAATQVTTLSGGPPYLQDGDRYVNTDSEDARIVLTGDKKYRVDSPKGPSRSVIVVPISGANKLTGDLGFDKKLNR